jgi:hypothetical protein
MGSALFLSDLLGSADPASRMLPPVVAVSVAISAGLGADRVMAWLSPTKRARFVSALLSHLSEPGDGTGEAREAYRPHDARGIRMHPDHEGTTK